MKIEIDDLQLQQARWALQDLQFMIEQHLDSAQVGSDMLLKLTLIENFFNDLQIEAVNE